MPVVDMSWLAKIATSGRIGTLHGHRPLSPSRRKRSATPLSAKGKERAIEQAEAVLDIDRKY